MVIDLFTIIQQGRIKREIAHDFIQARIKSINFNNMQFSDIQKKIRIQAHCDVTEYENTRISNVHDEPEVDLDGADLQNNENSYDQLRLETKQNDGGNVKEENNRNTLRWKDQPKEIKYIIYTLSVMLILQYIIVITAVIVFSLQKGEIEGSWTYWSQWSNCDVTCGNGTQTRARLCTNPFNLDGHSNCYGESTEKRSCLLNSCPDYGVAFYAYFLDNDLTEDPYTVLRFKQVYLNKGGAYNTTTGLFTCRIPGVYYFAVTLTKDRKVLQSVPAFLRINRSSRLYLYYDQHNNDVGTYIMTGTGTFHLRVNDTASIYGRPSYFDSSSYSSFTGFLVSPDV